MKRKQTLLLLMVTLLIASLACSLVGTAEEAVDAPEAPAEESAPDTDQEDADAGESHSDSEEEGEDSHADDTDATDAEGEAEDTTEADTEAHDYDTEFPLPADVQNFTGGGDQINFATSLNVEDSIQFYRDALTALGLTERTLNTAITETTFSMVFDGHENGKAIVVQGVDLGNGTTNINIRFEDV